VTRPDRLARTLRDAVDIVDELTHREVKLSIGGSVHDPTDPVSKLLFNVLAMVVQFETDLIRAPTREGVALAKANGDLRAAGCAADCAQGFLDTASGKLAGRPELDKALLSDK
jgi:DNA invertase Pin-like site-specific DNA recombinase